MFLPWCLSWLPQITVLLLSAIIFPQITCPFFLEYDGGKKKVIFHLTGDSMFLHLNARVELLKKNTVSTRKRSHPHRGNTSFIHRIIFLLEAHIVRQLVS